jgi:glutathione S-transferase
MAELLVMHHATCARKALFALFEKGAPVERRELQREYLRTPDYRRLNPDGVVPTFVDDAGRPLVESSLIMRYLDEAYDGPALQPADPWERIKVDLWLKRVDEKYFPALGAITAATFIRSMFGDPLDEARLKVMLDAMVNHGDRVMREDCVRQGLASPFVTAGLAVLRKMLDDIEAALGDREWLVGDMISLADCAMLPIVLRFAEFRLDGAFASRPKVAAWWQRLESRPSTKRLVELADRPLLDEVIASISDEARRYYREALG